MPFSLLSHQDDVRKVFSADPRLEPYANLATYLLFQRKYPGATALAEACLAALSAMDVTSDVTGAQARTSVKETLKRGARNAIKTKPAD